MPSNKSGETRIVTDNLGVGIKDFVLDLRRTLIVLLEHDRPAAGPSANTSAAIAGADVRIPLRKLSVSQGVSDIVIGSGKPHLLP